jgi:hypothetical protein
LAAHRDGLHRRLRLGWLLQNPEHFEAVKEADRRNAYVTARLRFTEDQRCIGELWAPDTCRANEAARVWLARALRLDEWLQRRDAFSWKQDSPDLCDPMLRELAERATKHRHQITQVLGIEVASKPTAILRQLLRLFGCQLIATRRRKGQGKSASAAYEYRIAPAALPAGVDLEAMQKAWAKSLGSFAPAQAEAVREAQWIGACREVLAQGLKLPGFFGRLFHERYGAAVEGVYQESPITNG